MINVRANLAKRLKELRLERKLTQVELAKLTGLSQTSLAMWENAERTPGLEYAVKLAMFFGCTIEYLVGLED